MTYSTVVIITVRNGKVVVAGSAEQLCLPFIFAELSKKSLSQNAADIVKIVTNVEAYDPHNGLGWLIINEFKGDGQFTFFDEAGELWIYDIHYTLLPEAIKLMDGYKWFELGELVGFREVEKSIVAEVLLIQ